MPCVDLWYTEHAMMSLAYQYLRWHYSVSLSSYRGIFQNFLWFLYNLFSIELMVRTLFVPFHRLKDHAAHHGLDVAAASEELVVNTLMRLVGFLMRCMLICAGALFIVLTLIVGGLFFAVWFLAPLLLALLVTAGVTLFMFV